MDTNDSPLADGVGKGGGSITDCELNDNENNGLEQAKALIRQALPNIRSDFATIADQPTFMGFRLEWNEQRQKLDKIPDSGYGGVSTRTIRQWNTLDVAIASVEQHEHLIGVGIRMGTKWDGLALVGIDFDGTHDGFTFPFASYGEMSISGKGAHQFVLAEAKDMAGLADNTKPPLKGCDGGEAYLGSGGRFIALTGLKLNDLPITQVVGKDLVLLQSLLKPAEAEHDTTPPEIGEGKPFPPDKHGLTANQRKLLEGKGQPEIDRSGELHGLSIRWIDGGETREDCLATLCGTEPLWQYALDHRQDDPERAAIFAREEVNRAYGASMTSKRSNLAKLAKLAKPAKLAGFSEKQKPEPAKARRDLIGTVGQADTTAEVIDTPKADTPAETTEANETALPIMETPPLPKRQPLSEQLASIPPYIWLVQGILLRGYLYAVLGHPNAGKTLVVLDMMLRLALGWPLGRHKVQRGRVVYIASENPDEVRLRIVLWCKEHKIDPSELDGWFDVYGTPVFFDAPSLVEEFIEDLDFAPDVVVVDTYRANFGGDDENKATDTMQWFNSVRDKLMAKFGCAVLALHHPPKGDDNLYNWCGSGAAGATLDGVWGVKNVDGTITLSQGKRRQPPFEDLHWTYQTKTIPDRRDNFGELATSVIARPTHCAGSNVMETLICMAVHRGLTTQREIGGFVGKAHNTISGYLADMRKTNREGGRLLGTKKGSLCLTPEGISLAEEGVRTGVSAFKDVVAKPSLEGVKYDKS